MSVQPSTLAGKYEILGLLGDGGQGAVYKVRHLMLGEIRAVKVQVHRGGDDDQARMRLQREGRALAKLRHPHIVTVYDLGEVDGQLFLEMEFIEGGDLTQYLGRRIPLETALEIARQIADALHYAHSQPYVDASGASQLGMIHRDVKPSNILVRNAYPIDVLLGDFGLVKLEGFDRTVDGSMLGTVRYAAPEQLGWMRDGEAVTIDPRVDVFSLGLLFYELVEGKSLHSGLEISQVLNRMVLGDADFEPKFHDDVPPRVQRLISQMLRRDPDDRPTTMRAVLSEIERILDEGGTDGDETVFIANGMGESGSQASMDRRPASRKPSRTEPRDEVRAQRRSTQSTDTPARRRKGPPTVLIVVVSLTIAAAVLGGLLLLRRARSPEPPSPQTRTTTAVEATVQSSMVPARTAQEILASARQLLVGLPCARVAAKDFRDGTLSVAGRVASEGQAGDLERSLLSIAEVRRIDRNLAVVQTPFCDALDILEPSQVRSTEGGVGVTVRPSRGCDEVYLSGERLVVDVTSSQPSRYVYVDYYVADRSQVAHLLPNRERSNGFLGADRTVRLGESRSAPSWEVSEPFGRELLTVVSSASPLFDAPRPQIESAMPYLEALRRAIDHVDVAAAHCFLQTSDR